MVCRILVADDSSTIQKVIRIGLASIQTDIKSVGSYVEATKVANPGQFDLIITDAGLPGVSTATDFVRLRDRAGQIPMILLMGSYDAVREADLRAVGIDNIIKKPFPPGELPELVQKLAGKAFQVIPSAASAPMGRESAEKFAAPVAFSLSDEGENVPPSLPDSRVASKSSLGQSIPWSHSASSSMSEPDDLLLAGIPPLPEVEPTRKGRPAYETPRPEQGIARAAYGTPSPPSQGSVGRQTGFDTVSGMSAAVEAFVRDELPSLVDRAVERYCADHFKTVAREVLTAELRRLAEEKARYLVDQ